MYVHKLYSQSLHTCIYIHIHTHIHLVGGFNPSEKYYIVIVSSVCYSQYMENMFQTTNQTLFYYTQISRL